jgi:hypothetical protein
VEGIRYGINQEKTRVVFDLSQPTDFRAFLLDGPPRIIVDLPTPSSNLIARESSKAA